MRTAKCIYDNWSGRIPTCDCGFFRCDYETCQRYIPTKAVEGQHAHWEAYYVCSNCGEHSSTVVAECPRCHARMDGKDT